MSEREPEIRTVNIVRYILPLREGGSLPAAVDADDGFEYVIKFRGAGQGVRALIAELLGGEIARALKLKVPELVFANLDAGFGRTEPDEEIQDLLKFSEGLNLGLHFLSGSITYDPVANSKEIAPEMAALIVWLDAFIANVDRTARNTNMLVRGGELWLIDHGAALYFHHNPEQWAENSRNPFAAIKNHVLLPAAADIFEADKVAHRLLNAEKLKHIVDLIPEDWLQTSQAAGAVGVSRRMYFDFLVDRLANSEIFVTEAEHARQRAI